MYRVVNLEILEDAYHTIVFKNDEIFDNLDFCDYNSQAVQLAMRVHGNIHTLYYIIGVLIDEHRKALSTIKRLKERVDELEVKNIEE